MQRVDYIIVGQGLAGSALAVQMLRRQRRVLLIDEPEKNRASKQAAGLFNPITGRFLLKTWLADTLFPYLEQFCREVEEHTCRKFFRPMPLYRPFVSFEEQNQWMGRSAEPRWRPYIKEVVTKGGTVEGLKDPYGGLFQNRTGYILTDVYMKAVRQWVRDAGFVDDAVFDEAKMRVTNDGVEYGTFSARRIIFCQGERMLESKAFPKIPIRPLKGETLTIRTDWNQEFIANRGVYVVPGQNKGEYRVGATYVFNDRSPGVTKDGRTFLEEKLRELVSFQYEVVAQDWGVRPTTKDRKPILGCLPGAEQLVVFNGLGTKGVSLAPYFSEVLIRWLENEAPIDQDVDLTRYY